MLTSATEGVLGADPSVELLGLEALLLGVSPESPHVATLMDRPDHAVMIAADSTDPAATTVVITKVADHTTALIAQATPEQLSAAMSSWSKIEEFHGQVTADELAEMTQALMPLFRDATRRGRHIYTRTTC